MEGRKSQQQLRQPRPKSKSPAERSEEFTSTQRRLKEEATARREAADRKDSDRKG